MLTISTSAECIMSESVEELSYTDLQPLTMDRSCFITSSSDPCLPEFLGDVSCVECIVQTEEPLSAGSHGCFVYTLPDSPASLIEDDCRIVEEDLYLNSKVYEEDDDDASVILDFMDLSFLDEESASEENGVEEGEKGEEYRHSFIDSLDACPTVIVKANPGCLMPDFYRFTPSPSPPTTPSPTPSPSASPSHHSTTTTTAPFSSPLSPTTTHIANTPYPHPSNIPSSTTMLTFHYCDLPTTVITIMDPAATTNDSVVTVLAPPSPPYSETGSSISMEMVSTQTDYTRKRRREGEEEEAEEEDGEEGKGSWGTKKRRSEGTAVVAEAVDFDSFDNSDDDGEDEDAGYKPYCDSKRGAKRNLLWKFLLWTLDHRSDVACWTDVQKGVFKFVNTARVSTLWGDRKKKTDMTFEKLSRGIRHYYKRGLMERLSHTRLMYKFNWDKVPRKFRKV